MSGSTFFRLLARPFFTGVMSLLPIGLTIGIVAWLAAVVTDLVGPGSAIGSMLKRVGWNFGPSETSAYFGGVLFAIILIYFLGLLVESGLKGRWETLTGGLLSRVPVIRTVYEAARKIVQMLEPRDSADMQSMTPIMCKFGGDDGTSFPAFLPTSETVRIQGAEYHVVMIPTAPLPFGGAIMCVPKESVTRIDCGIDGLFNIYMSMGTMMPDYMGGRVSSAAKEQEDSRSD